MYKITMNGFTLHDDTTDRTDDKVTSAVLTKEENNAGTLSYTVPPNHQYYDGFGKPHIGNDIKVYENRRVAVSPEPDSNRWEDILIWEGRPISWSEDFAGNINVECEGDMARLNDIVYPGQETFSGTLYSAFSAVMDYYNASTSREMKYNCSVLDNTKTVSMSLEEGTVLDVLTSIVNSSDSTLYLTYDLFFGELTLYVTGTTLDFVDGYRSQDITVDKNLIDLTKQIDYSEFATAIIPRDSNGNGVESVNDNSIVVIDTVSHAVYGHIEKIVTFDEPAVQNNPSALLAAAKKWFKSANNTRGEIDVTALDLSVVQNYNPAYANDLYRPFALRQGIWFNGSDTAEPVQMVINRMELDLINPANSRYSLSVSDNSSVKPVSMQSLASNDSAESRAATDEMSGYIGKKSDISYMTSKSKFSTRGLSDTLNLVQDFRVDGIGDSRQLVMTSHQLAFSNGLAKSDKKFDSTVTNIPEVLPPTGDNSYQEEAENTYREWMVETEDQISAIKSSKLVVSEDPLVTDSLDWQIPLLVNCNDIRKTNINTPYYSSGWLDPNEGYGGEFPMIRNFVGVYHAWSSSAGFSQNDAPVSYATAGYYTHIPVAMVYVGGHNGKWVVSKPAMWRERYATRYIKEGSKDGVGTYWNPAWPMSGFVSTGSSGIHGVSVQYLHSYAGTLLPKSARLTNDSLASELPNLYSTGQLDRILYTNSYSKLSNDSAALESRYGIGGGNTVGFQFYWTDYDTLNYKMGVCFKEDNGLIYWSDILVKADGSYVDQSQLGYYGAGGGENLNVYPYTYSIPYYDLNVNLTKSKLYFFKDMNYATAFVTHLRQLT